MSWPIVTQVVLFFIVVPLAALGVQYWYLPRRKRRLHEQEMEYREADAFWADLRRAHHGRTHHTNINRTEESAWPPRGK